VDAILTDQPGIQDITLTRTAASLNEDPVPVTGATVIVSNEDSTWFFSEDPGSPGNYLSKAGFYTTTGKTYSIQVYDGGTLYSATTTQEPGELFPQLQYVKDDDDGLYHIDWVTSAFTTGQPAMYEILISRPGQSGPDARLLFYSLPTLDLSEVYSPVMEQTTFPEGSIITEKRYSLTSGHAEFIRELMLETNWQGGMFPTASANVTTNLSNGALGYFGACGVTTLSIVVQPLK